MKPEASPTPRVWYAYVALCLLLSALNVGLAYLGYSVYRDDRWLVELLNMPAGSFREEGMLYLVSGAFFAVGNVVIPFLPRRAWAWVLHLTNIVAAILTCVLAPLAIPVLIGWFKPEVREIFDFR